MKIIGNNLDISKSNIVPIDDEIINKMSKLAFECTKDTELSYLRDKIYSSRYSSQNLEAKESLLESRLSTQFGTNVRTENQNREYKWVKINTQNMGEIAHRFYIAPNPNNLHELVGNLVQVFVSRNVPVRFKYQLTTGMKQCDRIIIYSDEQHKDLVEKSIQTVYNTRMPLFEGYERSLAWMTETRVPGVFYAPETKGEAYSNVFAEVILEAKETLNYLYDFRDKKITLQGDDARQAVEYMKLIIASIMLRKGLLRAKDGKTIQRIDKYVKIHYDYKTGILTHSNYDERGYFEVEFEQSQQGKEALMNNFYSVSKISSQPGLRIRYLTPSEWVEEKNKILYSDYYSYNSDRER